MSQWSLPNEQSKTQNMTNNKSQKNDIGQTRQYSNKNSGNMASDRLRMHQTQQNIPPLF